MDKDVEEILMAKDLGMNQIVSAQDGTYRCRGRKMGGCLIDIRTYELNQAHPECTVKQSHMLLLPLVSKPGILPKGVNNNILVPYTLPQACNI